MNGSLIRRIKITYNSRFKIINEKFARDFFFWLIQNSNSNLLKTNLSTFLECSTKIFVFFKSYLQGVLI